MFGVTSKTKHCSHNTRRSLPWYEPLPKKKGLPVVRASEKRWKGLKSFGFSVNYLSNLQHHSIKWFILLLVIASVPIAIRTTTLSYFLPLLQMLFIDLRCDSDLVCSVLLVQLDVRTSPITLWQSSIEWKMARW